MSNRLESLNPKKPAAKPGLKFKPKAVARKSEEARARDAPELKSEDTHRHGSSTRGRGSGRGRGRGRGASYAGTHVVSAGPLAMGSVGVGGGLTSLKTGLTNDRIYGAGGSLNSAGLSNLKLKVKEGDSVKAGDAEGSDSEDEADPTKINMNKAYKFADSETVLFPVRPDKARKTREDTPDFLLPLALAPASRAQTAISVGTPGSVKTEDSDFVAAPDAAPDVAVSAAVVNPDDKIEADEHDRILDDQRLIVDMITSEFGHMKTDDAAPSEALETPESPDLENYVLVHIPQITPTEPSDLEALKSHFASPQAQNFEGQIGSLNFHQLGKITMSVGLSVFQCAGGNPASFLQELYVIENSEADKNPEDVAEEEETSVLDSDGRKIAGRVYRLGAVTGKIVATPAIQ